MRVRGISNEPCGTRGKLKRGGPPSSPETFPSHRAQALTPCTFPVNVRFPLFFRRSQTSRYATAQNSEISLSASTFGVQRLRPLPGGAKRRQRFAERGLPVHRKVVVGVSHVRRFSVSPCPRVRSEGHALRVRGALCGCTPTLGKSSRGFCRSFARAEARAT